MCSKRKIAQAGRYYVSKGIEWASFDYNVVVSPLLKRENPWKQGAPSFCQLSNFQNHKF